MKNSKNTLKILNLTAITLASLTLLATATVATASKPALTAAQLAEREVVIKSLNFAPLLKPEQVSLYYGNKFKTNESYQAKPDFAAVEHKHPVQASALNALTPEKLKLLTQEELDQLYARLSSGPIPDGAYLGTVSFAEGGVESLVEMFRGGIHMEGTFEEMSKVAESLWKGKEFNKKEKMLMNLIDHATIFAPFITLNPLDFFNVAGATAVTINGNKMHKLFPAKVYCGQSMIDSRREAIVIDYSYNEEMDKAHGYSQNYFNKQFDGLFNKNGLTVRDEIRMIRPGFYMGRAYFARAFALNFFLYNDEVASKNLLSKESVSRAKAGQFADECYSGTQARGIRF